jgi:hypothetical protein
LNIFYGVIRSIMPVKPRSRDQTATSLSLPKELLEQISRRAAALRMSRSQYLCELAINDLAQRPPLVLRESNSTGRALEVIDASAASAGAAASARPAAGPTTKYPPVPRSKRKPSKPTSA